MTEDMKKLAPALSTVTAVAKRYFKVIHTVERVSQGLSTFVYRISTEEGIRYMRFLPEQASFAAEALVHRLLRERGVWAPAVVAMEHQNRDTGLSLMITEEIPGRSVQDLEPGKSLPGILQEAGRQLALLHQVPVEGFGWIDRSCHNRLKGEHATFRAYLEEYMDEDLKALECYDFTSQQRKQYAKWMEEALQVLDTPRAVLVHGDFDISHIFHWDGRFTGFIDFGEIRGCNPLFDLGTLLWTDDSPEKIFYRSVCEEYGQVRPIEAEMHCAVSLMALYQLLRFLSRKKDTGAKEFWYRKAVKQMNFILVEEKELV